jgi:hypothetical protein
LSVSFISFLALTKEAVGRPAPKGSAGAPTKMWQTNSYLALDPADGLLQHLGEEWVGLIDPDFVGELLRVLEHS